MGASSGDLCEGKPALPHAGWFQIVPWQPHLSTPEALSNNGASGAAYLRNSKKSCLAVRDKGKNCEKQQRKPQRQRRRRRRKCSETGMPPQPAEDVTWEQVDIPEQTAACGAQEKREEEAVGREELLGTDYSSIPIPFSC